MSQELDAVVLTRDIADARLWKGHIRAVVHRYPHGRSEMEFVTGSGDTVAFLTLIEGDLRPLVPREIPRRR